MPRLRSKTEGPAASTRLATVGNPGPLSKTIAPFAELKTILSPVGELLENRTLAPSGPAKARSAVSSKKPFPTRYEEMR